MSMEQLEDHESANVTCCTARTAVPSAATIDGTTLEAHVDLLCLYPGPLLETASAAAAFTVCHVLTLWGLTGNIRANEPAT